MKRSLRTARSAVLAVLAALALVGSAGSVASAAPTAASRVVYDALGDSYASGYGVPPYAECGRSQSAYAVQLDGRQRLRLDDFVACAGATTTSLVTGGQLAALDADTDLVTLTIGGNDIGWSSAVAACLGGTDAQCTGRGRRRRRADHEPAAGPARHGVRRRSPRPPPTPTSS